MNWLLDSNEITSLEDLPEGVTGFVYAILYMDDTYYIGKKDLFNKVTLAAKKNGEQRPNSTRVGKNKGGKRVYFDVLQKESNWLTYEGSCESTAGLTVIGKQILELSYSKRHLTYLEARTLFLEDALKDDCCHNANILGKFFRGNIN